MKILKFKIEGVAPLLQHDDKLANPFSELTKSMKAISAKRKKTEEDLLEMARIEWMASLYYNDIERYFIKAECFEGAIMNAGKAKKLGTVLKQSMSIPNNPQLLFRDSKLSPDKLYNIDNYKDVRSVCIQRARISRCRPIFTDWSCVVELWYEETRISEHELIDIVEYAGRYIGVCDYRPKFGRFNVTVIE